MMRKKITLLVSLLCLLLFGGVSVKSQFGCSFLIEMPTSREINPVFEKETLSQKTRELFSSSFLENKGQLENKEIFFYGYLENGLIGFGMSKVFLWDKTWDSAVTLEFVKSLKVQPKGIDSLETKSHFFLGNANVHTNVPNVKTIVYQNLWDGIDLYYKTTMKGIKYEFKVAPGANPNDIIIRCLGEDNLTIYADKITFEKNGKQLIDKGLTVFEENGQKIDAVIRSRGSNTFGFQIGNYNVHQTLVIDPLIYSTFVGGNLEDFANALALDKDGCAYITGRTSSVNFPISQGAYNDTYGGGEFGYNSFVCKLSADGSSLLYSTFIGGNFADTGHSIVVDDEGNAIVTGETLSRNFPTTDNAYSQTSSTHGDCFVFKLSADGSSLLFSTLVNGEGWDSGKELALDNEGNILVTGETFSTDFPTTEGAYDDSYNGGEYDCFVFKLSANGSNLLHSTFVGGSTEDRAYSLALDQDENIHVTGYTDSTDFPTTEGAYDESYNGGDFDCFVFKLSANFSVLRYSSFIGGEEDELNWKIVLDDEGNAYITGRTGSIDFPTTEEAYDYTYNEGLYDCFILKLSSNGSTLLYSSFIGGSGFDSGEALALDNQGNVIIAGFTSSTDFPITSDAYDKIMSGMEDLFVLKFSPFNSTVLYSTFIGGSLGDALNDLVVDNSGDAYATGETFSTNFPTTDDAYNQTYGGGEDYEEDCFVFKISLEEEPSSPPPTTVEPPPTTTEEIPTTTTPLQSSVYVTLPVITIFTNVVVILIIIVVVQKRKQSK
ncbi:MAG: hypothetical protein GF308_19635 [Candidatus Heimdallarchaeota archaeon]|nr:hypothetical protein [Candidatus Heimdallarchaeota archaeon]